MITSSLGDMALRFEMRGRGTELKQTVARLTNELNTGRTSDLIGRLGGDYGYLSDVEQTLVRLEGYKLASTEATILIGATQTRLGQIQDILSPLSETFFTASSFNPPELPDQAALEAKGQLATIMTSLNGVSGRRSLFSGLDTDSPALAPAEDLLNGLRTALTGATTAAQVDQAAKDWFADPAGFEAQIYTGSTQDLPPVRVGPGEELALSLRADDPVFRDMMRTVAVVALVTDPAIGLSQQEQSELLSMSAQSVLNVNDDLTAQRSDLGFAQARLQEIQTRTEATRSGLEQTRLLLVEADPFTTSTQLEEARLQLESLYAVTARLSQLSLVGFLR